MPETLTSTLVDLRLATLTALPFYLTAQCLNPESLMKAILCRVCKQLATKMTLISHECISVISLENILCS